MKTDLRRPITVLAACLAVAVSLTGLSALAQKDDKKSGKDGKDDDAKRPKLTLRAQPMISVGPSRIVFTAELNGGANDFQEYYCPAVQWDWDDGTQSESQFDCQPYESGKSEIKRRYTVEHVYRAGAFHVVFRLKRNDKILTFAGVNVQVQPGISDIR